MAFQQVARADEVPPGQTKFVCVAGRPILLANFEGRVYALDGLCPHRLNPLEGATMWDYLIDCPYHHFQYDVRTGENFFPKNVYPTDVPRLQEQVRPLAVYPVKVEDGVVWVDIW